MLQTEYEMNEWEGTRKAVGGGFRYLIGIILLICFYYTYPIIKTPYGYTTYIRLDDIVSFFFVLFSLSAIFGRYKMTETRFFPIIVVALALALPSIVWGFLLSRILKNFQYGIWQTVHYAKIFLIFLSAIVLPMNVKRFRKLVMIVWLGSVFVGIYGGLQYYGMISFRGLIEEFYASGPWGGGVEYFARTALGPLSHSHACIASYMTIAVLATLFLLRTAWGIAKPIYLASIPFFVVVILWSGGRAGLLGVFVGLLTYMIGSRVRPAAVLGVLGTGIAIYIVINAVPAIEERFLGLGGTSLYEYTSGRFAGWFKQIGFLFTHPQCLVAGIGLGNFSYMRERIGLIAGHNNYLHWLSECGILGLILPLLFFKRFAGVLKELALFSKFHREVAVAFAAMIIGVLALGLAQEVFVPSPSMVSFPAYLAFLLGCVVALYRTSILSGSVDEEESQLEIELPSD